MELHVNGKTVAVEAAPDTPLLWIIRDDLALTGTKYGCGLAQCGACTVLIDGAAARSCVTPVGRAVGKSITTIEAVEADEVGGKVVEAWVSHQVPQCGYCQSGQVMAVTALLKKIPTPTEAQVHAAIANLCRCGTYNQISSAVRQLAGLDVAAAPSASLDDPDELPAKSASASTAVMAAAAVIAGAGAKLAFQEQTASDPDQSSEETR